MKEKLLMEYLCSHHRAVAKNGMLRKVVEGIVRYSEDQAKDNETMRAMLKALLEPLQINDHVLDFNRVVLNDDKKAVIATISKEMLRSGLGDADEDGKLMNTGTIRFETNQQAEGTVARIGDYWFYFSDPVAAEGAPEDYITATSVDTMVKELSEAMEELANDVSVEEYMYYYYALREAAGDAPVFHETVPVEDEPKKLSVKTPKGIMTAEAKGTYDEYPGFFIAMEDGYEEGDPLMATVEYDTSNDRLQIAGYRKGSDDLNTLTDYDTGENLL